MRLILIFALIISYSKSMSINEVSFLVVGQSNIVARVPDYRYNVRNDVRILVDDKFVKMNIDGEYINKVFDELIDNTPLTRVNYTNIAVGGSSSDEWSQSGYLFKSVEDISHIPFDILLYHQGEHDTAYNTTEDKYFDNLSSFVIGVNALYPNIKIFVAIVSYRDGGRTSIDVTNAQKRVIEKFDNVFMGASTDTITERIDGTHFSIEGAMIAVTLWGEKLTSTFVDVILVTIITMFMD